MMELLMDTGLDAHQTELAHNVCRSASILLGIINDILDFSKIEAGRLELETVSFDLHQAIKGTMELFAERARSKGLAFSHRIDSEVFPVVGGDPVRLRQILINLTNNAIKFTEEGEVTIRVSAVEDRENEQCVCFEVSDTGIGVPPEARERIFHAFSQADNSTTRKYGGSGLGLVISRQLAEMMGGKIGVHGRHGKGSIFWFTARLKKEREAIPEASFETPALDILPNSPKGDASTTFRGRALVVEDNPINQEVTIAMLAGAGCRVTLAPNGRKAIDAFSSTSFDIIFMDCQMPEMDGYECARIIRKHEAESGTRPGRPIPIVALTAHAMKGDREKCLEAGMDDYLSKPFSRRQLQTVLGRWLPIGSMDPSEDGEVTLDVHVLDSIRDLQMEDEPDILSDIVERYFETSRKSIEAIENAVHRDDPVTVYQEAHSLKSSSVTLGAVRLGELCSQLEAMGRGSAKGDIPELFARLRIEYEKFKVALHEECTVNLNPRDSAD